MCFNIALITRAGKNQPGYNQFDFEFLEFDRETNQYVPNVSSISEGQIVNARTDRSIRKSSYAAARYLVHHCTTGQMAMVEHFRIVVWVWIVMHNLLVD